MQASMGTAGGEDDAGGLLRQAITAQRPDALVGVLASRWQQIRADPGLLAAAGRGLLRADDPAASLYLLRRAAVLRPDDPALDADLGWARWHAHDTAGARLAFSRALARDPDSASALHGLGSCLRQTGDLPGAITALTRAVANRPQALSLRLELVDAHAAASDFSAAQARLHEVAEHASEQPVYWLAQARLLRALGHPEQALRWIDRYGRQHPQDAPAWIEKARCLRAAGRIAEARAWLERLEARQPGIPENSDEYGQCLSEPALASLRIAHWTRAIRLYAERGDFPPAQRLAAQLLAAHPDSAAAWDAQARIEHSRQHWAAAESAWKKALAIDPAYLDAAAGLAHLYEDSNRVEPAVTVARAGLAQIAPGDGRSGAIELHLALCKAARRANDVGDGLSHLARAQALVVSDSQREYVAFECGRLLDLAGDVDAAFAAFTQGNQLAQAAWEHAHPGANRYLAGVEALLARARAGWLQSLKPIAAASSTTSPAFLIGFPRSGTSLLNQVLDGHPGIAAMEEKPPAQTLLAAVRAIPRGYPDALVDLDALDLELLRETYFGAAAQHGGGARDKLLLDKFPLHTNIAALLHRVFPDARFVFALRHPCDVVLSCFMQQFRPNHAMANFCTLQGAVDLYCRTMDLWELVRTQLPLSVHSIRYEDVVADFDGQVRALCDFLHVPWHDDLHGFAERAQRRGRIDTPSYAQVSRPLYRDALQRWRRYEAHLTPWLASLQPYIERFGYA
ncbi:MAG: sulfotransferase [Proteobacteria bacterium]|nr:sulfotransferase [Pseudomonadota bacterium]